MYSSSDTPKYFSASLIHEAKINNDGQQESFVTTSLVFILASAHNVT